MIAANILSIIILSVFEGYSAEAVEISERMTVRMATESDCVETVYSISGEGSDISEVLGNEKVCELLSSADYPSEDRAWLESQIRKETAVRNGSFLSRDGDRIERDFLFRRLINDYWSDCVIAVSDEHELTPDRYMLYDIAVYDIYGNLITSYKANVNSMITSSDGTVVFTQDGGKDIVFSFGENLYLTLQNCTEDEWIRTVADREMYSRNLSHAVSNDGSLVAYNLFDNDNNYSLSNIYICNNRLDVQEEIPVVGMMQHITISPDNRYVAFSDAHEQLSGVFDCNSRQILFSTNTGYNTPRFSSNSEYCVLPSILCPSENLIINLTDKTVKALSSNHLESNGVKYNWGWYISNDGSIIAIGNSIIHNNEIVYQTEERRQCVISPSGCFAVIKSRAGSFSIAVVNAEGGR
ncbi:hypothetical protein CSA37_01870 [Candidatus Fermentibacteria bacterium]|nr:MAG: hypothetical protein CSA37_01870 [Candidatus Fermentibacteria bacterium]